MNLTNIDLAIADVDALKLLALLRNDNPRGFHTLTRAAARIVRRVVTGNAAQVVRFPSTADFVIHGLIYSYDRNLALGKPLATDIHNDRDRCMRGGCKHINRNACERANATATDIHNDRGNAR